MYLRFDVLLLIDNQIFIIYNLDFTVRNIEKDVLKLDFITQKGWFKYYLEMKSTV